MFRVYENLLTEVFPKNVHFDDLPLPDESMPGLKNQHKTRGFGYSLHRARERALNAIAVHNIDKWMRNEYDRNLYKTERNLLLARILIKKAYIKEGTALLQSTYNTVCKHEHTAYSLLYAQELCMRYAMAGRHHHFYKHVNAITIHMNNLKSESVCLQAYYKTVKLLANKWDVNNRTVKSVNALWKIITKEKTAHATHTNCVCFFRAGIYYYQTAEKYPEVIRLSKQFENYLKRKAHLMQDGTMAEIAHYLVNACIAQKKFLQGIGYMKTYSGYFSKGNTNRIPFMELHMQLLLHSEKYSEALNLYNEVTATFMFKKAGTFTKETWIVYKAYIDFAMRDANLLRSFRTAHFLNIFEDISRDKSGLNFEVLVIAFLYKLVKGDLFDLEDFNTYFDGYVKRHLRQRDYFRSYYFSKMLQVVFRYNFDPEKAEKIAGKFLKMLKKNPGPKRKDKKIMEIIPYEKLWTMVINLLKEKKKRFTPF